jgi:RNA polymerase sigma-70 factor (ECF subfamily)
MLLNEAWRMLWSGGSLLQGLQLTPDSTMAGRADGPLGSDKEPVRIDAQSLIEMTSEVYEELRRLAASYLRSERSEHTLRRTALVHEAFLRLADQPSLAWENRAHFIGVFARIMRQTLTNYAIARTRQKRGGTDPLEMALEFYDQRKIDVTALDLALKELESLDPRQGQIVELRFFGGLTVPEIASAMEISPATVKREWALAKIWLRRELSRGI